MGITDTVGGLLSISEPSARFLIGLYSAYPLAFVYKALFSKRSAWIQNVFFTAAGFWVMYFVYGAYMWHSLLDVLVVYGILVLFGGSLTAVTLTWLVTMGHMMAGYVHVMLSDEVHPISWTIPHCVLVLKLIGLSYNLYDAKRNPATISDDMKLVAVAEKPSFLELLGFCYFMGSVLSGPQMSFIRYRQFVEGKLYNVETTPSSIPAGLQRFLVSCVFSGLYSLFNRNYPLTYLLTDEFGAQTFLYKLWLVFISGKIALWRYVTVWLVAEGSCIITGISYVPKEDGTIDWNGLANIHIIRNELCITLQDVIEAFNINTNQWFFLYVFKRLKWAGNKSFSHLVTLLLVSVWHGVWPGYYFNFSFEFIAIFAERSFLSFMKKALGVKGLDDFNMVVRVPLVLAAFTLKNVVLMYPVVQFMLLTWDSCYRFMTLVYFYGHIVIIGWLLLHTLVLKNLYRPKKKET
ncbi:hypothetical protein EMCRGX_G016837 [Ephydatia muelleri]|eukprot:Em0008g506a